MPMPMPDSRKLPVKNTFRAIQNALLASKACDITGVAAICCARHGCFVPNALVDLLKGEQAEECGLCIDSLLGDRRRHGGAGNHAHI